MAGNRFKNSVEAAVSNTSGVMPDNMTDNALDNTLDNTKYNILKSVSEKERKGRGGNHTFYLSAEVSEKLNRLAKKTRKSKSTLVNDILKAVFEADRE